MHVRRWCHLTLPLVTTCCIIVMAACTGAGAGSQAESSSISSAEAALPSTAAATSSAAATATTPTTGPWRISPVSVLDVSTESTPNGFWSLLFTVAIMNNTSGLLRLDSKAKGSRMLAQVTAGGYVYPTEPAPLFFEPPEFWDPNLNSDIYHSGGMGGGQLAIPPGFQFPFGAIVNVAKNVVPETLDIIAEPGSGWSGHLAIPLAAFSTSNLANAVFIPRSAYKSTGVDSIHQGRLTLAISDVHLRNACEANYDGILLRVLDVHLQITNDSGYAVRGISPELTAYDAGGGVFDIHFTNTRIPSVAPGEAANMHLLSDVNTVDAVHGTLSQGACPPGGYPHVYPPFKLLVVLPPATDQSGKAVGAAQWAIYDIGTPAEGPAFKPFNCYTGFLCWQGN